LVNFHCVFIFFIAAYLLFVHYTFGLVSHYAYAKDVERMAVWGYRGGSPTAGQA